VTDLQDAGDAILAERSADGDTDAFAVLVRRHAPFLRAYAIRLLGSARADADDCVQEALIAAWKALPELQDPGRFRSWVVAIVSRKATDRLRRRRPDDAVLDAAVASSRPDPEDSAITSSQMAAVRVALDALPEDLRTAWILREVGGRSYDEIADHLDVPVATVRGRLARARQSLLDAMKEWR
jgi:RNA polymerase sigma-70 factor, ECF subfamily